MKLGQKLLVSIGPMFIFSETGSENEFPRSGDPGKQKALYNSIYNIPLGGLLISQQQNIFRYSDLLISQQSDIFRLI